MSAWTGRSSTARPTNRLFRLVLESRDGKAQGANCEEKHEPASDIDIALMDSLKVLDPEGPIREADICEPQDVQMRSPSAQVDKARSPVCMPLTASSDITRQWGSSRTSRRPPHLHLGRRRTPGFHWPHSSPIHQLGWPERSPLRPRPSLPCRRECPEAPEDLERPPGLGHLRRLGCPEHLADRRVLALQGLPWVRGLGHRRRG